MANDKKTATTEKETEVQVNNTVLVIGSCPVVISKEQTLKPGETVELSDVQLESQAIKYLFLTKVLEFEDDSNRTRKFISGIKRKSVAVPKTIKAAEGEFDKEF